MNLVSLRRNPFVGRGRGEKSSEGVSIKEQTPAFHVFLEGILFLLSKDGIYILSIWESLLFTQLPFII